MFDQKINSKLKVDLSIVTISHAVNEYLFRNINSCNFKNISYEQLIVIPKKEKNKIHKFPLNKNIRWLFDSGTGVYAAINQGLKNTVGKYIMILHGDNFLVNNACDEIEKSLKGNSTQFGCFLYMNCQKRVKFFFPKINFVNLLFGLYPPHPGLIITRKDFDTLGLYNEDYKICSDYDYYIKILKYKINLNYNYNCLINSQSGGISTSGFQSVKKIYKERVLIFRKFYPFLFRIESLTIFIGYIFKIFDRSKNNFFQIFFIRKTV